MPESSSITPPPVTKRLPSQPVLFVLGVVAVLSAGYWLASLAPLDGVFEAARRNGKTALDPVFYGIAGVAAFVLLLAALQFFDTLLKRFGNTDPLDGFPERSIDEFASDASESQISVRLARESYVLLRHYYRGRMCIDLDHDLRDDLNLTDHDIIQLQGELLNRTERREMRDLTAANIETVHDLLDYVEKAPTQLVEGVAGRVRPPDVPSSERDAAAASSFFLRDQVSGQSRRASDYIGPRRRASDSKVKRAYSGPHRRATDRLLAPPTGKSGERPRERSADKPVADLNKQDPNFVPPRYRKITN